jgi:hypothetical protein
LPEVGFGEIAIDFLEARFWTAEGERENRVVVRFPRRIWVELTS